jgi:RNA recognition motif-containing protein
VFYDPETGRSKGGGIVEFKTKSEADVAIDRLNKSTLKGRVISVREDRDDFSVGGAAHGTRVYAGNLSWQVDWYDLKVCYVVLCGWFLLSLFSLYTDIYVCV